MDTIYSNLLDSDEPSVRYKALIGIFNLPVSHPEVSNAQAAIRTCEKVKVLLSGRDRNGEINTHPYKKWQGAHWTLAILAELGYPPGDASLIPLREQVLNWLFSTSYSKYIRTINGRVRICASISANVILSILKLGLGDDRIDLLIKRIVDWQWLDGGWNCDKRPAACHSSFMESLLPLRALIQYAQNQGTLPVRSAIQRASELFLQHEIYKRTSDGSLILPEFLLLRHPRYWHYDILGSLIALEGAGKLNDPRCKPALIKLKEMRLPSGGYCANGKYYQLRQPELSQYSPVDWAPVRKGKTNLFITVEALTILQKSGLISSPEEKLDLKSLQAT